MTKKPRVSEEAIYEYFEGYKKDKSTLVTIANALGCDVRQVSRVRRKLMETNGLSGYELKEPRVDTGAQRKNVFRVKMTGADKLAIIKDYADAFLNPKEIMAKYSIGPEVFSTLLRDQELLEQTGLTSEAFVLPSILYYRTRNSKLKYQDISSICRQYNEGITVSILSKQFATASERITRLLQYFLSPYLPNENKVFRFVKVAHKYRDSKGNYVTS